MCIRDRFYLPACFAKVDHYARRIHKTAVSPGINTRGATIYGSNRSYLRRMIMHIQYHEDPLLAHLAENVRSRPVGRDADPLNAFLQRRPFPAAQPRRPGFWTTNDRSQRPLIRIDAQPTEQEHSRRNIGRAHHQIETALYDRCRPFTR